MVWRHASDTIACRQGTPDSGHARVRALAPQSYRMQQLIDGNKHYRSAVTKQCPNPKCGTDIMKEPDGMCLHIKCKCGTDFCWECLATPMHGKASLLARSRCRGLFCHAFVGTLRAPGARASCLNVASRRAVLDAYTPRPKCTRKHASQTRMWQTVVNSHNVMGSKSPELWRKT